MKKRLSVQLISGKNYLKEKIRTRDTDKAEANALEQSADNVKTNVDMVISEKDDHDVNN